MAQLSTKEPSNTTEDVPPIDSAAVSRAYRFHRARRRARLERIRATRRAGIRFWVVLVLLLAASVGLAVTFWRQVQELFGL